MRGLMPVVPAFDAASASRRPAVGAARPSAQPGTELALLLLALTSPLGERAT
jgi:hypothetical protein